MGQYLNKPRTDKASEEGGEPDGLHYGLSAMQGWRTGMEDAHIAKLRIDEQDQDIAVFGVFDGHGGAEVARYCERNLVNVLVETEAFHHGNWGDAIRDTFFKVDDQLRTPEVQVELEDLKDKKNPAEEVRIDMADIEGSLERLAANGVNVTDEQVQMLQDLARKSFVGEGDSIESDSESESEDEENSPTPPLATRSVAKRGAAAAKGEQQGPQGGAKGKRKAEKEEEPQAAAARDAAGPAGKKPRKGAAEVAAREAPAASKADAKPAASSPGGGAAAAKPRSRGRIGEDRSIEEIEEDLLNLSEEEPADPSDDDDFDDEFDDGDPGQVVVSHSEEKPGFGSGTTAVVCLVIGGEKIVVGNAGDSRCVLCRGGKAVDMSFDHKPEDDKETDRIEAAGGEVLNGRVEGNLNLSRALGDLTFKARADLPPAAQMISAEPDIETMDLTPEDEFIVLGCDGVFNVLTSQQTVNFVRQRLRRKQPLSLTAICEQLCDRCCAKDTSGDGTGLDNVTAMIIKLPPIANGKPQQMASGSKHAAETNGTATKPRKKAKGL